jgi:hypothetical protein
LGIALTAALACGEDAPEDPSGAGGGLTAVTATAGEDTGTEGGSSGGSGSADASGSGGGGGSSGGGTTTAAQGTSAAATGDAEPQGLEENLESAAVDLAGAAELAALVLPEAALLSAELAEFSRGDWRYELGLWDGAAGWLVVVDVASGAAAEPVALELVADEQAAWAASGAAIASARAAGEALELAAAVRVAEARVRLARGYEATLVLEGELGAPHWSVRLIRDSLVFREPVRLDGSDAE